MSWNINWDVVQLVLAIVFDWTAMGLVAGGAAFASRQKELATRAADNYDKHVRAFRWTVALGPVGFVGTFGNIVSGRWKYHGLLFPGSSSWSRIDAEALQRRAMRGSDTTVD